MFLPNKPFWRHKSWASFCDYSVVRSWGQCYKTFYAVIYHHFIVMPTFCIIKLYYIGNYQGKISKLPWLKVLQHRWFQTFRPSGFNVMKILQYLHFLGLKYYCKLSWYLSLPPWTNLIKLFSVVIYWHSTIYFNVT